MAIVFGPTFASLSSLSLGSSNCQICQNEGICYSMSSAGAITCWARSLLDGRRASDPTSLSVVVFSPRCKNLLFGKVQTHWLPTGQDLRLSKVSVASDYSDSVPDSSNYKRIQGYHPLEELKVYDRSRETMLTSAEIARTTVEANSSALLILPGMVHREPHGHMSWAEFQYVIDDCGDIFFEIFDDENILQDRWAVNPVNVLIGMDIPMHVDKGIADNPSNNPDIGNNDDDPFDNESFEVAGPEVSDTSLDWGMVDSSHSIHPVYFAKCLTKAINTKYGRRMDHPSNGISILGCLRPALMDDELYLRRLFHSNDSDGYSDWKDEPERQEEQVAASYHSIDGEMFSSHSQHDGANISSTLYKLDIMRIELFSVYGVQSVINLEDFQDAEPDFLVHSASTIVERFTEKGMKCKFALKALCRKKGFDVEGANLLGVDSLGMDVRVFSGAEAQTLRFPFKSRATSGSAAEKKIQRMLFPRYHRKKIKTQCDELGDSDSF